MAPVLSIPHGTPIWLSPAIVPSRDTVVAPGSSPTLATITVSSTGIFVYVQVVNTGTADFGACTCSPVPAAWATVSFLPGFLANAAGATTQTQGGVTFTASPAGDSLAGGGINFNFGVSASGRRSWGWSPDGLLFAYAGSPNGSDWYLTVVALQNITRSNGTTVLRGQAAVSGASGVWAGPWTNTNFGWAGSRAVVASGQAPTGGIARVVACPYAPPNNTYGELVPAFPGQVDWTYLASPCGSVVAFVPKILQPGVAAENAYLISTASAQVIPFKVNNVPTSVAIVGANPSITTLAHSARGVQVNTGAGVTVSVDDPDCTLVGGGVSVTVDRVKASTLPGANLGVVGVGTSAIGLLRQGQSVWVQVPNTNGWANQSEPHWCLLAQAYTSDGTTIPRPWNGQAPNPPPFPLTQINCAQRNIQIQ